MPFLVVAFLIVVLLGVAMLATVQLVGLLLTLAIAGLVGWAADAVVPGRLPGGWLGAVLAGIAGGFLGSLLGISIGPRLFGVHVIPAFVGAVVIALAAELIGRSRAQRSLE